ncbi:MAG TPA: hypothetical protein VNE17_03425 [Nitrolancea sp.]|nr:hypothetical protein [Nitrolancea sp.]
MSLLGVGEEWLKPDPPLTHRFGERWGLFIPANAFKQLRAERALDLPTAPIGRV